MTLFKKKQNLEFSSAPAAEALIFKRITESDDFKEGYKERTHWRPRRMRTSEGVEKTGVPQIYQEGSPEQALGEFLYAWKTKDYLRMSEITMPFTKETSFAKFTKHIAEVFVEVDVQEFYFLDLEDLNPSTSNINVKIKHFSGKKAGELTLDVKMKFLNKEKEAGVFGFEEGIWTFDWTDLHPINFY